MIKKISIAQGVALYAGLPMAIIVAGAMLARAYDTTWIANGQTVSASKLQGDLEAIKTMLSTGPTFCGATTTMYDGITVGGYTPASVNYCQSMTITPGCKGSSTAHVCTANEIVRSSEISISIPTASGWYANGVARPTEAGTDCGGWSSNASSYTGSTWNGGPTYSPCNLMHPILCCDLAL